MLGKRSGALKHEHSGVRDKMIHDSSPQSGIWIRLVDKIRTFHLNLKYRHKQFFKPSISQVRATVRSVVANNNPKVNDFYLIVWLVLYRVHRAENWFRPAVLQSLLIAVNLRLRWLSSVLRREKKHAVCSSLFSFYLYFKPHTRCRVELELVTGAYDCIIHKQEPTGANAK